jgi:alkylhydroperoxidase/carboxymuconolactone decarboxylase family protein YurZ
MSTPTEDLRTFLDDAELGALRGGFDPAFMRDKVAGAMLFAKFPPGTAYVQAVLDTTYSGSPLCDKTRERLLVALLASRNETMTLAVHLYWALMTGSTLDELGHVLLLAGQYAGISTYTNGMGILKKTCAAMRAQVLSGKVDTFSVGVAIISGI